LFIAGSRLISVWRVATEIDSPDQYFEGSPVDRLVLAALLAAGLAVLIVRGRSAQTFLRRNLPILLFFAYCAASIVWSDYTAVAFKRWTKALGDLVMVMVVLTDPDPFAAIRRLFARTAFVLIPVSVLLVKYYPDLGRGYDPWTWTPYYGGVAIGKNSLGYVCLVFGLASLWRFLTAFHSGPRRSLIAHGVVVTMALWLFWIANSATSLGCFILGSALLVLTTMPAFTRSARTPHVLTASIAVCAFIIVLLDAGNVFVQAMGRDTTLTGRTELWDRLVQMRVEPFFGAGFESFWLGDRVEKLWSVYWWHPRQAHNGYLETFLNLGLAGLGLIGYLMAAGYRNATAAFRSNPASGSLGLTFLVVALAYNLTEAAFKTMHPIWIALLLATALPVMSWRRQAAAA
jgi:exopolysaccharide production protein ExoQ